MMERDVDYKTYFYSIKEIFPLKRNIGKFTIPEPFYRTLKIGDKGNDVWRIKFLFSKYLFYNGSGTPYEIDDYLDEKFFTEIEKLKREKNIDEKDIGFKTFSFLIDSTFENFIFFITVDLPDNRNLLGKLKLFDKNGNLLYECPAKGKGQHDISTKESQKKVDGDTPIGVYLASYESGILKCDHEKFGYNGIFRLWRPLFGEALWIYKVNRDGILIHGGSENKELRSTHGCIIIHNNDQKELQKMMIKIGHPYLLPSHYVEFYTGIVMVRRVFQE